MDVLFLRYTHCGRGGDKRGHFCRLVVAVCHHWLCFVEACLQVLDGRCFVVPCSCCSPFIEVVPALTGLLTCPGEGL